MEPYYFGGYFLIKTRPLRFGPIKDEVVQSCCSCINISAFDIDWYLSWTGDINDDEKAELGLTDEKVERIHQWTDRKFDEGTITWGNALPDLETISTFKNLFYAGRPDINIYSLYVSKTDAACLIADFEFEGEDPYHYHKQFGLRQNVQKQIEEKDNSTGEFLGYDFIGVENHGNFHSFHCHNILDELRDKFSLTLNQNGLFDRVPDPDVIREYLNDETTRVEPVPWYIARTKRLNNDLHKVR